MMAQAAEASRRLCAFTTRDPVLVRQAQRLRKIAFEATAPCLNAGEFDADDLDDFCTHLVVRDDGTNEIVGTYRLLSGTEAASAGGFYSQREFVLSENIVALGDRLLEAGRACVHPDYRGGSVMFCLWAGLGRFATRNGYQYLIGCSSIPLNDSWGDAVDVCRYALSNHLSPAYWRASPITPLPLEGQSISHTPALPPLLKGYLKMGAYVCGNPAWDKDVATADLFTLLPLDQLRGSYARRFLGNA